MPLEPAMAMILNQINSMPKVPMSEISPESFREQQALLPEPTIPVKEVYDRTLSLEGRDLTVRVYVPESAGVPPYSALVFYHGGGWVVGNLDSHDSVCRFLAAKSGCVVLSVDYRLAPEHKFPAAVQDAYDAFANISSLAEELGIHRDRIAVGGDSAGGNLAAVTSINHRKGTGRPKNSIPASALSVDRLSGRAAFYAGKCRGIFFDGRGDVVVPTTLP
ncbi:alpha/beta hydrolase [Alicyclobacillus sp. SO9]|uniref:alpha/beta hydrolase n=1 Tax=Alicyclobacillus sp. SO9 TaxID=2665646 RepID=UPI00351CB1FE